MSDKEVTLRDQVEAAYEDIVNPEEHVETPDPVEPINDQKDDIPSKDDHIEAKYSHVSEQDTGPAEAPSNWAPEDVEAFNELDDRGKKLYLKRHKEREASYTKKFQALAEDRRVSENFKKVMASHEEHLRSIGVDPFMAVDKLLATERLLRTGTPEQKLQALQRITQDYGINNIQQTQYSNEGQQQYDPQTLALLQKVQSLEHQQQLINQDRVQRETESLVSQIDAFQNAKDEKGEPKYPHFETLKLDMSKNLKSGMAQNLEQAYNIALRLNDDLHQEYINIQYNNRMREADNLKKTVASKKAGFNVKGSGGSSIKEAPSDNLSRRQIIEQAYASQEKRQRI